MRCGSVSPYGFLVAAEFAHLVMREIEQVGVNAPGSEMTTTRLPLNSSTVPTFCQRYGLGPGTVSSRTRVLNIKSGTGRPSVGRDERFKRYRFAAKKCSTLARKRI